MNIVLLGLRGSGKSTVGHMLARRLGRPLVDLDERTLALLGCATVAEAWQLYGEEGFREAESSALAEALASSGEVIALGGGTPTAPGALAVLQGAKDNRHAVLIYLRADAATLRARLVGGRVADRPSLTGSDPLAEMEAVLAARDPVYRAVADHVLDARKAAGEVVEEIARLTGAE